MLTNVVTLITMKSEKFLAPERFLARPTREIQKSFVLLEQMIFDQFKGALVPST